MPALRLSQTAAFGTPPIAESAFTCAPIQSGNVSVRRAERRDKDTCAMLGARDGIKHRDGIAGPIDEQLLARHMRLAHRRRDALAPLDIEVTEPTVAVAVRVLRSVFLPEQQQRHAAPFELLLDRRPVRLRLRRPN